MTRYGLFNVRGKEFGATLARGGDVPANQHLCEFSVTLFDGAENALMLITDFWRRSNVSFDRTRNKRNSGYSSEHSSSMSNGFRLAWTMR